MKQFTYFTPINIISALQDTAIWSYDAETEFEKLGRDAFVEIILASCLLFQESFEGFFIFVLRPVESEQVFFKNILAFLEKFLRKVELSMLPSHVESFLSEIRSLAGSSSITIDKQCMLERSLHIEESSTSSISAKSKNLIDLTLIDSHSPEVSDKKQSVRSRKILVYSVNALRSFGGIGGTATSTQSPFSKLLAAMRKLGMDMIFPQASHDMLLCIIYALLSSNISSKTLTIDVEEEAKRVERGEAKISIYPSIHPFIHSSFIHSFTLLK